MKLTVMAAAQGHGELVAHFEAERPRLRGLQVVRVARLSAADEAGLSGDVAEVRFITAALGLGDRQDAFVDAAGEKVFGRWRERRRDRLGSGCTVEGFLRRLPLGSCDRKRR